jgi:putative nucleotidyltransferase with HDIG domain
LVALRVYAAVLAVGAIGLAAALVSLGFGLGSMGVVALLAGLALLAEQRCVRLTPSIEFSVGFLPFVFAGIVFGPFAAMVVAAIGLAGEIGRPYTRWVIWTSSRALVAGVAASTAWLLGAGNDPGFSELALAVAAATVVEVVLDGLFTAGTISIRGTGSLRSMVRATAPLLVAAVPLYTPVIAVLAYAYREVSAWSVGLFLVPAFAAQRLFVLYREQSETAERLAAVNDRLEKANLSFATALVATLDARDKYTAGHSAAVAVYARDIARRMGLSEKEQELAHLCGLVHDIGKIGLPPGLLEKTGPLTLDERRQMEQHSVIGEGILTNVEDYSAIARVVRHHHERVDGQGYPDRLAGDEIPLLSRILAVADAYDAMTSDRPYRDAMPSRVARLRLAQAVESQFDTSVVAAFEAILASASEAYKHSFRAEITASRESWRSRAVAAA